MLVQFVVVVFNSSQTVNDFPIRDDTIPRPVCMIFNETFSKYVFCIDASIDIAQICADNGFLFEYAHNLEVPIENYSEQYSICVNFGQPNQYYLAEIIKRPPVEMPPLEPPTSP